MEDKELEELKEKFAEKKQELAVKEQEEKNMVVKDDDTTMALSNSINNTMQAILDNSVEKNIGGVQDLADNAVKTELEIKNEQVVGRKEVEKSKIRRNVTEEKTKEDEAKHERSKTILKAQGLTSQLPTIYRVTALVLGYPFYVLYLLTFGWIVLLLTFIVKGFITMVADCAERFADVNKKFIDNGNEKKFNLGKAMLNIAKWILIIGAVTAVVVLLILK